MFHIWNEPGAPRTGGGGDSRPKVRLKKPLLLNLL